MKTQLDSTTGSPKPLGLSIHGDRANFSLFSAQASRVILGVFWDKNLQEFELNRSGDVWHIEIQGIPVGAEYAYRCEGGSGGLYNPSVWLSDPYGKIAGTNKRIQVALPKPFDWQGVKQPRLPLKDLVIYEMHVRGFTQDASSGVSHPGTYLGVIEKIPYLKKLGINAVELMPIFEFDEHHCKNIDPKTGKRLVNYWGYNPELFFALKKGYAAIDSTSEFKTLVRELHRNGIEVILDGVYNHTGEGKEKDYYVNLRGIDNQTYYMVDEMGNYRDFTGCGNTINANHPVVQRLILDSLRYWVEEMHIDGFRFDLASVFTRDLSGKQMGRSPLIEAIVNDPVIKQVKLIAEPWDAAGLYQVGAFPKWGPWSEWNGRYRDIVRKFIKGTDGKAGLFASALCGSEMIYRSSSPLSSINFVTAHDGYSLRDLVTYQEKHNWENGEQNRDGSNDNENWNCGHEGPSNDPKITELRERQMRNFLLALFVSQGVPMILMGDEYGHTRLGNNNPYVQDNEINWFLWNQIDPKIFNFVQFLISFRKQHQVLRSERFLTDEDVEWYTNWDESSRLVFFRLKNILIAFNAYHEPRKIQLPEGKWKQIILTEEDWHFDPKGKPISEEMELISYSALLAVRE